VTGERTRIGYVIGQLTHGGAERQLYELVRGIDSKRFQCFVYCLSEWISPYGDMIRETGATLRILKRQGHFDLARIFQLASLIRRDRVDILHAFLFLANGYACPARLLARVPHLVTSARNCKEIGLVRGWINRMAFRMSDAIACNGVAVQSYVVQRYQAPLKKSVVIYNGLDFTRFSATPVSDKENAHRADSRERRVMTIGRLVPQKDLSLFLDAAALLARKAPDVRFVIIGDGPCRESLEQYASQNGLDRRVSFLGERSDVPELLQTADVFWLTSAWEGLSNVLLEAMACAKPIVVRDVGACREIVCHGVNGYVVPQRDPEQFVQHTLDLLANPQGAREMGQAGRGIVEAKFSASAMIHASEKLYDSLIIHSCVNASVRNSAPVNKRSGLDEAQRNLG
jgi:glycosyltransferase involved in cell wall biosynthesis